MNFMTFLFLSFLIVFVRSHEETTYQYFQNGDDWGDLCDEGYRQSPIDITSDIMMKCDAVSMKLYLNNSNNEIQFDLHETHFITTYISDTLAMIEATDILNRKQTYILKHDENTHFHTPGEHLINGFRPDLSMHMVFLREGQHTHEDDHAVIEIMFVKVAEEFSEKLSGDRFLHQLGIKQHPKKVTVNFAHLLRDIIQKPDFYHYKGSLTTPPCSESVSWFVYKHPLEISSESIDFLEDAWINDWKFSNGKGNFRSGQYLNGRKVFEVTADVEFEFEEPKLIDLIGQKLISNILIMLMVLLAII